MSRGNENCVYVMVPDTDGGPIKIGSSQRPEDRRAGNSQHAGVRMHLVSVWIVEGDRAAAYRVEKAAHKILAPYLTHGLEWFSASQGQADEAIRRAADELGFVLRSRPPVPLQVITFPNFRKAVQDVLDRFAITEAELDEHCATWLGRYGSNFAATLSLRGQG